MIKYDRSAIATAHEFNINVNTREIYLHEYYSSDSGYGEPGIEYRMASIFVKNLNLLNQICNKDILIHQHTTGGCWNDGIAIYDALRASVSPTVMMVYAEASSMSSVTIQGATTRLLFPNVEFMVHDGYIGAEGIPRQVKSVIDQGKKIDEKMLKIYAERCINGKFFKQKKMNEKDVINYIKNKIQIKIDWFMDSEEAVFYGFADGVITKVDFLNKKKTKK